MTFLLRQIAGLVLIAALAFLAFTSMTGISAERLRLAKLEADRLDTWQAMLSQRKRDLAQTTAPEPAFPEDLIWVPPSDSTVELMMQTAMLDAAGAAGLQVTSFGAADGPKTTQQPTLGFEIEGTGGHVELAQFLAKVENTRPRLAVSSLWIRQVAPSEGQLIAPVEVRMTVWGFGEVVK